MIIRSGVIVGEAVLMHKHITPLSMIICHDAYEFTYNYNAEGC